MKGLVWSVVTGKTETDFQKHCIKNPPESTSLLSFPKNTVRHRKPRKTEQTKQMSEKPKSRSEHSGSQGRWGRKMDRIQTGLNFNMHQKRALCKQGSRKIDIPGYPGAAVWSRQAGKARSQLPTSTAKIWTLVSLQIHLPPLIDSRRCKTVMFCICIYSVLQFFRVR